ncbi:MAG: RNA 2',3'-cyclic phosphodiesterase [Ignavibacteria bacterium]
MRAFISLNLDDEIRAILTNFQKNIKDGLGITESRKVKWESPDKFHITMFFVGDIGEDKIEDLKEKLKDINEEQIGKVSLEITRAGGFPDLGRPRVIFAEVTDKEQKLNKLSDAINKTMKDLGFEQSAKYRAHITLGRVRRDCRINGLTDITVKGNFDVNKVHIMRSTLNSDGAVHESIFSAEL